MNECLRKNQKYEIFLKKPKLKFNCCFDSKQQLKAIKIQLKVYSKLLNKP